MSSNSHKTDLELLDFHVFFRTSSCQTGRYSQVWKTGSFQVHCYRIHFFKLQTVLYYCMCMLLFYEFLIHQSTGTRASSSSFQIYCCYFRNLRIEKGFTAAPSPELICKENPSKKKVCSSLNWCQHSRIR